MVAEVAKITKDYQQVWANCLNIIRDNIDEKNFNTWFVPIIPIGIDKTTLILQLPTHMFYEWLEEHYINLLKKVIKKELGNTGKLQYRVIMEKRTAPNVSQTIYLSSNPRNTVSNPSINVPIELYKTDNAEFPAPFVVPGIKKHKIPSNLVETYNFDNYVEGNCNRLARTAGWAIAQDPCGTSFNPFFIYSEVGLGKTHLAHAIGLQTKANFPNKTVLYINADTFYQQFIEATKTNNRNDFILYYQSIDMLIIDDIEHLGTGNKEKTQEAFFHIFNHLHLKKKQIIITSDKPPVDISGFEARLLSRFKWGLTAELTTPDFETRTKILQKKLECNGITFPDEVTTYLAARINSNTRELEGAMIAILAQASLNHRPVTEELAKEMVDKYVKSTAKHISIEYIQKIVGEYFNVSIEKINANKRDRDIVQPRQICMFFARKYAKLPYASIGSYYGGRNHATVLHACNTISDLYETDKKMKTYIDEIDKKMKI
ncbi:MAG: chromosomal replication initiator protein DnaA [Bacteroidales bacterium]|jgi:chromosomal replication initiator protein|nr:chromosomal replication initiator protein DnaA [Bacteroidales bacterium]